MDQVIDFPGILIKIMDNSFSHQLSGVIDAKYMILILRVCSTVLL